MHATQLLLTSQVYPMLMSSVPHAWGILDRKNTLFKLIAKFVLKGNNFMFGHDIVYIELLYCERNFELVWTGNKVAVVENANKCRLYPTFPYRKMYGQLLHRCIQFIKRLFMKFAYKNSKLV